MLAQEPLDHSIPVGFLGWERSTSNHQGLSASLVPTLLQLLMLWQASLHLLPADLALVPHGVLRSNPAWQFYSVKGNSE